EPGSVHSIPNAVAVLWGITTRCPGARVDCSSILPFLPKRMALHRPGRPVQPQQALERIVAADVVATYAVHRAFPGAVGVSAEGKGDAVGVAPEQLLDAGVAGEAVPQPAIQRRGRPWPGEAQIVKGRMVRDHDELAGLLAGRQEMSLQGGPHERGEAH